MKLLPYDTFKVRTPDSLTQVIQRLEAYIEAPKRFRWGEVGDRVCYQGTLSDSGFEISRLINYRNSFLPLIRGRFEALPDGTLIHITMRVHPFVLCFLLFWCSGWFTPTIPIFLVGVFSGDIPLEALLFLGLPIGVLCIFWFGFWSEAHRSRRELTEIILGERVGEVTWSHQAHNAWPLSYSIVAIAGILICLLGSLVPTIQRYFQPAISLKECSQVSIESSYCNFSVLRTLDRHPTASALAISADGNTLVSGGSDKAIRVWDLPTGQLRKTLQSDSGVIEALAIAPDGQTVVSGSGDRMVRVWNIASNQRPTILKGHSSKIQQVTLCLEGKRIVSTSNGELKVWDLDSGQLKAVLPNLLPTEVKIGSISIQKQPPSFFPLAIAPDCQTALVEFDNRLVAWDLQTNQKTVLKKANLFLESIDSAYISQDGKTAVTASYKRPSLHLKVWDLTTGSLNVERSFTSSSKERKLYPTLTSAAIGNDRLIASLPERLMVWNLKTAELEAVLKEPPMRFLAIGPDGKYLAGLIVNPQSGNRTIRVLQRF